MTTSGLIASVRELANLADIRGTPGEASCWRRVAADLEHAGEAEAVRLTQLARENRLADITTVDPEVHGKLQQILLEGPAASINAARTGVPWLLRRLLHSATVDSAAAATLARNGIVTLSDLEEGLQEGHVARYLPSGEEPLRVAAEILSFHRPHVPLGRAVDLLETLMLIIGGACPQAESLTISGDTRRFEPLVETLVIVAAAADPAAVIEAICSLDQIESALYRTSRRALVADQQVEVDLRIATPEEFGSTLHATTGSRDHLAAIRSRQRTKRACTREEDVYSRAGLRWIPAEIRHNTGEIEAAEQGTLPSLVTREHIRGDLHMHSTYSDGVDSLDQMVETCVALGYEYIAITDHSERANASRTVSVEALARQRDEIARLRERFPAMTILHGAEVDIMPDGRLDFADAVLETLDIVLASLHDHAGHDGARLTRRVIAALEHPLVNIFTHPSNRLVGRDRGYDLDFAAVYAAATATGTALEIDGAPNHLDLDGEHARQAIAARATLIIDSDCHRARLLDRQMRLGVGTARRGWVEPRHVLNTRALADLRAFIAAKRRRAR